MLTFITLFALPSFVFAHAWPTNAIFGNTKVKCWGADDGRATDSRPDRLNRKIDSNTPITDVTSAAITCNWLSLKHLANVKSSVVQQHVKAGEEVTFLWTVWPDSHKGPVITYMADCQGDCTTFDGSTGNVWFKVDEAGITNVNKKDDTTQHTWALDDLKSNNNSWTMTIPAELAPGQYLIRHELIALHNTGHPQLYPSCLQISLDSDGTQKPTANYLAAFPGAYKASDPGLTFNIYAQGYTTYPIPGPPLWTPSGGGSSSSSSSTTQPVSTDTDTNTDTTQTTDSTTTSSQDTTSHGSHHSGSRRLK